MQDEEWLLYKVATLFGWLHCALGTRRKDAKRFDKTRFDLACNGSMQYDINRHSQMGHDTPGHKMSLLFFLHEGFVTPLTIDTLGAWRSNGHFRCGTSSHPVPRRAVSRPWSRQLDHVSGFVKYSWQTHQSLKHFWFEVDLRRRPVFRDVSF